MTYIHTGSFEPKVGEDHKPYEMIIQTGKSQFSKEYKGAIVGWSTWINDARLSYQTLYKFDINLYAVFHELQENDLSNIVNHRDLFTPCFAFRENSRIFRSDGNPAYQRKMYKQGLFKNTELAHHLYIDHDRDLLYDGGRSINDRLKYSWIERKKFKEFGVVLGFHFARQLIVGSDECSWS